MAFISSKKNTEINPEVAQCERQLEQLEQYMQRCYLEIGKRYAEEHDAKAAEGTPYEKSIVELEGLEARRVLLEKRKLAVQGLRKCEKCGAILNVDSAFCNKCGEKLEEIAPEVMTDAPLCPSCKNPVEKGSTFCTYCGASLEKEAAKTEKTVTQKVCSACGMLCGTEDMFCINCGERL